MEPVLVVGPGALGLLIAVRLQAAGVPTVLAARTAAAARALDKDLEVQDVDGRVVRARVPVVHRPKNLKAPPGLLVVATKCQAAPEALRTWIPACRPEALAVCLQNGILGDRLMAIAGDRLVECTVGFPATLEAPGRSVQTGAGHLHLGAWPTRPVDIRLRWLQGVLEHAAPTRLETDMRGVKWTKLLVNSAASSLGALTGQELGVLLADPRAREAFRRVVLEGHAAGKAEGVRFQRVSGFHPRILEVTGLLGGRAMQHALLRVIGRKYRRMRSSSLQGLDRGRRTEVDFLNGHIVRVAEDHGLPAPVNRVVVDRVHAIEDGDLAPGMGLLDGLPL